MQPCPNCGNQLPAGATFCARCGQHLTPMGGATPPIQQMLSRSPLPQPSSRNRGGAANRPAATVQTIERPPRPRPGNRAEVYTDGSFMLYKKTQLAGSPATRNRPGPVARPTRKHRPTLVGKLFTPLFTHAGDPEAEKPARPRPQPTGLGWLPVIALTSALGLFTTATAFNAARENMPATELYFWLGLVLFYLPPVVRLLLPHPSRMERAGLLVVLTLCLYLTKVELSPLYFNHYDEMLHWRSVNDIMSVGHLFTPNMLLPVSPVYPGLEIVTSTVSNLSGLDTFQSGLIVLAMSGLLMIFSLFLMFELLTGSARVASIAAAIYMTNPHFLTFDSQFAYESLALPLATFAMFAMVRYETLNNGRIWVMLTAWFVMAAMILTHHVTNFLFEVMFLLWSTIYLFIGTLPLRRSVVVPTVIAGFTLTVGSILLIGNVVITYLASIIIDISNQVQRALNSSGSSSRPLFSSVQPTPIWDRGLTLGAVALITLAIPFVLLCFWQRYRRNPLLWVFALFITSYPVLQILRFTSGGAEASSRSSAFVFIPVGLLLAIAIVQFWPVRSLNWRKTAMLSVAMLVLFMGGIVLGESAPASFLPGPYQAGADGRSIDPEGIQAALWTRQYLGPDNYMYSDRIGQLLLGVYGDQQLVTQLGSHIEEVEVIFDPQVTSYEISLLQKGRIHYLAIDMRMSQQLPQNGYYIEQGEPGTGSYTKPLDPALLTKFDTVPQINRLFDSGNIAIYDTGVLIHAPQKP